MKSKDTQKFGQAVLDGIKRRPFGSMNKREVELMLLKALLDAGYLGPEPAALARELKLTMTKAHGYLTDLALRQEPLTDKEALKRLKDLIDASEVQVGAKDLLLPTHDASLRIWLERKLAEGRLLQGETLRKDLIRLSPYAVAYLLDVSREIPSPAASIKALEKAFPDAPWIKEAKAEWDPSTKWRDALGLFADFNNFAQSIGALLGLFFPLEARYLASNL